MLYSPMKQLPSRVRWQRMHHLYCDFRIAGSSTHDDVTVPLVGANQRRSGRTRHADGYSGGGVVGVYAPSTYERRNGGIVSCTITAAKDPS